MMSTYHPYRSILVLALLASVITVAHAGTDLTPIHLSQKRDVAAMLNRYLKTTDAQKPEVNRIVEACQAKTEEIRADSKLSKEEKQTQTRVAWEEASASLRQILKPEQMEKFRAIQGRLAGASNEKKSSFIPTIGIRYDLYFPTSSTTRSIFGDSPASINFSFRPQSAAGRNGRIGFSIDTFRIQQGDNNVFVFSPQIAYERRTPVSDSLTAFYRVSGGPAYIDYSYDDLSNGHFGAKRLGASLGFGTGLRYGPIQLSATYRFVTRTAPINFDGLQLSLGYTMRF